MKVLKFGGKSLSNGSPLHGALDIIEQSSKADKIVVVLSARGNSTNELEDLLDRAARGEAYEALLDQFFEYQVAPSETLSFAQEFQDINRILGGVSLLGEYSLKIKDRLLSYGEILSAKTVVSLLAQRHLEARFVDTRDLIKTDDRHGSARVLTDISEQNVCQFFANSDSATIEIATGFIATNLQNQTTTLGRNGSNYSATLLASFLNATEVQNWTNVDGVYTANPNLVDEAKIIRNLSFREANELANFGTNVLHAKTILPLVEKRIPIRILNSFHPTDEGTLINEQGDGKGIKAVSVIDKVALISLEGRGLLGKVGIDGRIFSALSKKNISVRIISQASSERGIGFIVDIENADKAKTTLSKEFEQELNVADISEIEVNKEVAVISVIGRNLNFFDEVFATLHRNQIRPYLFSNTITGEHVSLVVADSQLRKAANLIHGHIFGVAQRLNVLLLGKGNVGATLINQLLETQERILDRKSLRLNIFGIADSKQLLLNKNGVEQNWREELQQNGIFNYSFEDVYRFVERNHIENVVLVDNTASEDLVANYPEFIDHGFDIVASNKHANTQPYPFYANLRQLLKSNRKHYLYETNVGAGLPLIDTIKLLHTSGDKIQRIRGIFSGSLSFIFNQFSSADIVFTDVLQQAIDGGLTEPDPREDLSGNDVARKLLILARELDLTNNLEEVEIDSLIPENLREGVTVQAFLAAQAQLNAYFEQRKSKTQTDEVLRYVGDLDVDTKQLKVSLEAVPSDSTLGSLKGSDSIFEIFTESYGQQPLVIRGAGAGAEVTARGVYADLLKLAEYI